MEARNGRLRMMVYIVIALYISTYISKIRRVRHECVTERAAKFNCIFAQVHATVGTHSFSRGTLMRGINSRYECRRTLINVFVVGDMLRIWSKRYTIGIINRF